MFVVNIIKTITCVGVKMKTENKNISTFNIFYLAEPNKSVTQERDQYIRYARRARNIQHKHLQTKGVQEVFHKLFACPFCVHK